MYAIHRQAAPPSGVDYSLSARITPSCLQGSSTARSKTFRNLITARNDFLQLFEIVEEVVEAPNSGIAASPSGEVNGQQDVHERQSEEKKPAINGATEFGQNGQNSPSSISETTSTRARLRFVREYRMHGTITGLQRIQTIDTARDGLDRLLISFKHAKASLLEWSSEAYDLVTASLHTFEKLPQLIQGDLTGYRSLLRVDPLSRCAGLLLPQDAMAITPFFQDQIELEGAEEGMASLPYAPSSVVNLTEISPQLRHIKDFVFLAGFNEPTMAILSQPEQTWTGRLENAKDVSQLCLLTIDVTATPPSSTIISQTSTLPYDCLHLTPCPRDLGGVIITTNNALIHVDQAGKRTGVSLNPWAKIVSDSCKFDLSTDEALPLEASSLLFITADVALLFLKNGRVRAIKVQRDGRTISKIVVLPDHIEKTVPPSSIELIRSHLAPKAIDGTTQACYAFVGSLVGDSQIVRVDFRTIMDSALLREGEETKPETKQEGDQVMEEDEDEIDIYGSAEAKEAAQTDDRDSRIAAASRFVISTSTSFNMPAYGPIRAAAIGPIKENGPAELVACTGDEVSGGLTIIHRSFAPVRRRKLDLDHSTEAIWTLEIIEPDGQQQTYLLTSSEGETQVYLLQDDEHAEYVKTFAKTTLSAASFREGTHIVYLLRDSLVIVNGHFREVQKLTLAKEAKIKSATVAGSYILVERLEAPPLLFQDVNSTLESVPWPANLPNKAALFHDSHNTFPALSREKLKTTRGELYKAATTTADKANGDGFNDDDIYGEPGTKTSVPTKEENAEMDLNGESDGAACSPQTWLFTTTQQGVVKIFLLPDFERVFSSADILAQPATIEDSQQEESLEEVSEDTAIEDLHIHYAGGDMMTPHLLILLEDGTLLVYEAFEDFGVASLRPGPERSLALRWVKVHAHALGTARRPRIAGDEDSLGPAPRHLVPFTNLDEYTGVFVTGDNPVWLIKSDAASSRIVESALKPAYGFTAYQSKCLTSIGEEVIVGEVSPTTCLYREHPFTKVVEGRLFTDIIFDQDSRCFAALSAFSAPFEVFQEEGEPLWPHDAEQALEPTGTRSALELIEPGTWTSLDGYEFRQYETALSISNVTLETKSTVSGSKQYVAVGTIISRGEDLASRGALYVFEVLSVEGTKHETTPRRKLRLLSTEDLKAPISNVSSLNNYLLHSVGLKIYGKAFDEDERLLSIGFLDVGVHTTCIRTLKNLILIGDAVKGLAFIAFQEEPYKFVTLGQEVVNTPVTTADFLISEGKALLVASDMYGNVRLYEYDPLRAETQAGQRLLPRVEFHAGAEAVHSIPFARAAVDDPKQSGILYLHVDGSLSTIVPVREAVYKRLQLLERQLVRHTHHFAGLNPRAYRTVHNAFVPRPLTKGLLDGDLLSTYSMLNTVRQQQLADPLGSDSDTLNYNIRSLKAPW